MPPKLSPAPLSPLLVATAMGQAGRLEHSGMQRTGPRSRSPRRHPGPAVRACGRLLGFTSPRGPTASPPLPRLLLVGPGPSEMPAAHAEPRTQTKHKTAWGGGAGPAAEPAHERRPSSLAALTPPPLQLRARPGPPLGYLKHLIPARCLGPSPARGVSDSPCVGLPCVCVSFTLVISLLLSLVAISSLDPPKGSGRGGKEAPPHMSKLINLHETNRYLLR